MRNELPYDVSAKARTASHWIAADIGFAVATIVYSLPKTMLEVAFKSGLVAKETVARHSRSGGPVRSGKSAVVHKAGLLDRFTSPSGVAGILGARPVRVVVTDPTGERAVTVTSRPGMKWSITEDGLVNDRGEWFLWEAQPASDTPAAQSGRAPA